MTQRPRLQGHLKVLGHMARLKRFTAEDLSAAAEVLPDTARAMMRECESLGWVRLDGHGERRGPRGLRPNQYTWLGVPNA